MQGFFFFALLHLSSALFEICDETLQLDTDDAVEISSLSTLTAKNVSSCRYTLVAPANYLIDVKCILQMDQHNSQQCPYKRFFISVDGIDDLRGADYFCSRNGTNRRVRRRSIMNRVVLAYATQLDVANETYTCVAKRMKSDCECGWARRARIYNGDNAQMHEFPSMLALVALSLNRVFCGSVIISERWALTSAHCFNEEVYRDLRNVVAFAGEHDLTMENETIYTESYEIEKFVVHENYSQDDYLQDFDIALLKMAQTIIFNRGVGPACLPFNFQDDEFDDLYVTVAGFGLLTYYGGPAKVLQKVSLQVLPAKFCKDSIDNSRKMCTYAENKDSCVSDSGGPLYFIRNRLYVIALVSYGVGCGSKTPSVNTRITSYLPWIEKITAGEDFCRK